MTKNDAPTGTGKASQPYRTRTVRANGIDIHYLEAGAGEPLQPTLVLIGDRDRHCSVEEGVAAYRALKDGALAVLPSSPRANAGGWLDSGTAVEATIAFFESVRRAS